MIRRAESRGSRFRVDQGEPQSRGLLAQGSDVPFPIAAFKFLGTYIFVLDMKFQHMINGARDLIGGGDLGI